MKRICSILVALVALTNTLCAQIQFGLEGGLNLNQISFNKDVFNSGNRAGFFVGPKMRFLIPVVGLGVDGAILYAQKNSLIKTTTASAEKKDMRFVEVPVNLRWDIKIPVVTPYIATGPQWDWYVGDIDLTTKEGIQATFKRHIFSWNVGAGIVLFNHLQLGASYNIPITKSGSVKEVLETVTNEIDMKNRAWDIRLNYYF